MKGGGKEGRKGGVEGKGGIPLEVRHDLCRHVDTRVLEYVVIKGVVSQHDDTIM